MNNLLNKLNPAQKEAAMHKEGPLLVMAGAGSGKTRVLTSRIAYLLSEGVAPYRILAITFTNKAAAEMKERVMSLVGAEYAKDIWLSTFHSFCARFLRTEIENALGYNRNFVIYDTGECQTLIKNCLKELNLDEKRFVPNAVLAAISSAKNVLKGAEEAAREADNFYNVKISEIYRLYQQKLRANNALDFDDLLMLSVAVLETDDAVREKYQRKFDYIMIDEYQDTNGAQYKLAKILAERRQNIFVVGDVDQSIYAWRGADIRNILDFEKDYPDAKIIKLEQNYRSTQTILDAANAIIENNRARREKNLWTQNGTGDLIQCYQAVNEQDEANYITDTIFKLNKIYNTLYGQIAVLYRTNAQSRAIEEGLMKAGIPYAMVGGVKFYERKEIKDILAYMKVIFNPNDTLSLLRIINVPRRGIGQTTVGRLLEYAAQKETPLFDVVSNPAEVEGLGKKACVQLEALAELIFNFISCQNDEPIVDLVKKIIAETGYAAALEVENTIEAQARLENLQELLSVAQEVANLPETGEPQSSLEKFLTHVSLVADLDSLEESENRVTLMTLHAAKGLEFPAVFLAGMEEGIFPHARTLTNEDEIEEERRLCYVGLTRARRSLYLTYAHSRLLYGNVVCYQPSRFLNEIPAELVEQFAKPKKREAPLAANYGYSAKPSNFTILSSPPPPVAAKPSLPSTDWKVGEKVYHAKWGNGTIVETKGTGESKELGIAFAGLGIKKLLASAAPLSKV
ncbi:MAG: DNA helicase PcrA [Sporomusaceae bacterium]|jgi:DNA helicase-2/ATP-dependent DNA helicase PcrA|nr:DNA helicase PcrA [Sporomusaceae bacterium]